MPVQSRLAIALDPAVSARLDGPAQRDGKYATELAAVADYVALDAEHVAEIEAAVREADAGDFASEKLIADHTG